MYRLLNNKKYDIFFLNWKEILGLKEEPIKFNQLDIPSNSPRVSHITYDDNLDSWVINIGPVTHFRIIHELGHLYIAWYLDDIDLIDFVKLKKSEANMNAELYQYIEKYIDCFVNYYLLKFDDFYQYLLTNFPEKQAFIIPEELIPENKFNDLLCTYIYKYIHLKCILKKEDRKKRQKGTIITINNLREVIITKAKEENIDFTTNEIHRLNKYLNNFNIVKDNQASEEIINYILKNILVLGFWENDILKEQFKIIFNTNLF
jgi:hypothetical protein